MHSPLCSPLVTIAIPTYNRGEGYLRQSLGSALAQTYENIEIIVADNCSQDNTSEVVRRFDDDRIQYFRHDRNIGANNNFNFCLEQAAGRYFQLLQDDDMIDRDFVQACIDKVRDGQDYGIIRTGTRVIDAAGHVLRERPNEINGASVEEFFLGWFSGKTVLYLCSTLFHTQRLLESGGFNSKKQLFQDVIAEILLASKYGRADVRDVKASFRKHAQEMTFAAKVSDWCEDSLVLLNLMYELADQNPDLRRRGLRFFSRLNYSRAEAVKGFLNRVKTYRMVFEAFDHQYSPPRYFYDKNVAARLKTFRQVLTKRLRNGTNGSQMNGQAHQPLLNGSM